MTQSRAMSLVEAATNVVVGYVLAIAMQLAMFTLFGFEAALADHLLIGLAFFGVSLARGYLLRRLFDRWSELRADGGTTCADGSAEGDLFVPRFATDRAGA